jgi:hypothetical protein
MNAATYLRRASTTILRTAALAVCCTMTTSLALADPQPESQPTPAFMFLDLPSASGHQAVELPLLSFSYDAQAGVPLDRRSTLTASEGNVRATMLLAATADAPPFTAKTPYASIEIVQTDSSRTPVQRLTFHDVTIATVEPAGDQPAVRVTFTARTVIATK